MVLGTPLPPQGRLEELAQLRVQAQMSDGRQFEGVGSNVLGDPAKVTSGMRVAVCFEHHEDVWLPMFAADTGAGHAS